MKVDKTTGLPELPEGFFWRVVPKYAEYGGGILGVAVQLIERRKGFLGRTKELVLTESSTITEDVRSNIKGSAQILFEWLTKSEEFIYFVGDYPPNNINEGGHK